METSHRVIVISIFLALSTIYVSQLDLISSTEPINNLHTHRTPSSRPDGNICLFFYDYLDGFFRALLLWCYWNVLCGEFRSVWEVSRRFFMIFRVRRIADFWRQSLILSFDKWFRRECLRNLKLYSVGLESQWDSDSFSLWPLALISDWKLENWINLNWKCWESARVERMELQWAEPKSKKLHNLLNWFHFPRVVRLIFVLDGEQKRRKIETKGKLTWKKKRTCRDEHSWLTWRMKTA